MMIKKQEKNAIVLCSGGIDSVTTAFYVKNKLNYKSLTIMFFNYNQRNIKPEIFFSKQCTKSLKANFVGINVSNLSKFSSSLLNSKANHNKIERKDLKDTKEESKNWYIPARNLVFLSYALAFSDFLLLNKKVKSDIFVGFKNEGSENFPDTSKIFVKQINNISKETTESKPKIIAPLIQKDKEDIIDLATKLKVDLKKTFSCYTSSDLRHCGTCLACILRKEGFHWANIKDPTIYKE